MLGSGIRGSSFQPSRLYARLKPRVLAFDGDGELDLVGAPLFLKISGFLANELLKRFEREPSSIFSRLFLRAAEGRIQCFHFFRFLIGVVAGDRDRE